MGFCSSQEEKKVIYKGKCKSHSKKGRMCKQRGVTERRTRYMGKERVAERRTTG